MAAEDRCDDEFDDLRHRVVELEATLDLAERQALSLAAGDLDAEVFDIDNPSRFAPALHDAVGRLRESVRDMNSQRQVLSEVANTDYLTWLSNRRGAMEILDRLLDADHPNLAVAMIDVDRFKAVNDRYGHGVGDELLRVVARRLDELTPAWASLARTGGDEFLVIVAAEDETDARELGDHLASGFGVPNRLAQMTVRATVSVGVVFVGQRTTSTTVLHYADEALHRAKAGGRSRAVLADDELRARLDRDRAMADELRLAIDDGSLKLAFQPIVRCGETVPKRFEALTRWSRNGVPVSPAVFIPLAEESDLILDLDRWVLKTVVGELARWQSAPEGQCPTIMVNISARHICLGGIASFLSGAATERHLDLRSLVIEITEEAVIDDVGRAIDEIARLRHLGVQIALDDYGSGHASLANLRTLPISILKVDQLFTKSIQSEREYALVALIIETARVLGIETVVEGVETPDQAAIIVNQLRPDYCQGYLFGRPSFDDPYLVMEQAAARRDDCIRLAEPQAELALISSSAPSPRGSVPRTTR